MGSLEKFRIDRELTYKQLAKFLGIPKTTTFRICHNDAKRIDVRTALQIERMTDGAVSVEEVAA